jgi:hypothetical protein
MNIQKEFSSPLRFYPVIYFLISEQVPVLFNRLDSIQSPSGFFSSRESVLAKTGYSPPFTAAALLGFCLLTAFFL